MAFADLLAVADSAALDHLGRTVRYTPQFGDPVDVRGVFDSVFVLNVSTAGGPGVEGVRPAVFLRLADLPKDPDEDEPTIEVDGVRYTARERQKDGMGGVLIFLREMDG